jgi:hypothetical protein
LVLVVLILILVLVPLLFSHIAVADGVDPGGVRQPGTIAEHRTDAIEQEPAADHPGRRCARAEKRSPRSKGRAYARTRRIGRPLRGISCLRLMRSGRGGRRLRGLGAHTGYGTAGVAPAEHGVAHAVEETALWLLLVASDLRLQLLNARVGALERLIHDQRRLHQRVDCMRRLSQAIRDHALGSWVAGAILQFGSSTNSCSCGVMRLSLAFTSAASNFYEFSEGEWVYRGDSEAILNDVQRLHRQRKASERPFGETLRCSGCHINGGLLQKELAPPHNDWFTQERQLPLGTLKPDTFVKGRLMDLVDAGELSKLNLVEDIRKHGLREPISLFERKIIDGRNRERACIKAGVEPRYRSIMFDNHDAAAA